MKEKRFSKEVEAELSYYMEIEREWAYSREWAIHDAEEFAENQIPKSSLDKKILREIRSYLIELGVYESREDHELGMVYTSSGIKKAYDFKMNNKKYKFISWIPLLGEEYCNG